MTALVKNLKALRSKRGLSQQRVADMNGLTRSQIASYESGVSEPNICTLIKLSHFYGTPVDFLIK